MARWRDALPASGDNPALLLLKLGTLAGLVALALTHARALGALVDAGLGILSNMLALVAGRSNNPRSSPNYRT